jgi:hypothetical protein
LVLKPAITVMTISLEDKPEEMAEKAAPARPAMGMKEPAT